VGVFGRNSLIYGGCVSSDWLNYSEVDSYPLPLACAGHHDGN